MRQAFVLILMGFLGFSLARGDFSIEKDRLQRRYEDFYLRIQEKKKKDIMRQNQAKAHKKRRQERAKDYDSTRRNFVRKKPKSREGQKFKYEKLAKKRIQQYHQLRLEYIRQRDRLEKVREESMRIPPEKDVGLE